MLTPFVRNQLTSRYPVEAIASMFAKVHLTSARMTSGHVHTSADPIVIIAIVILIVILIVITVIIILIILIIIITTAFVT